MRSVLSAGLNLKDSDIMRPLQYVKKTSRQKYAQTTNITAQTLAARTPHHAWRFQHVVTIRNSARTSARSPRVTIFNSIVSTSRRVATIPVRERQHDSILLNNK